MASSKKPKAEQITFAERRAMLVGISNDNLQNELLALPSKLAVLAAEERKLQAEANAKALIADKPPRKIRQRSQCPHCKKFNSTVEKTKRKGNIAATQYMLCHETSCGLRWNRPRKR